MLYESPLILTLAELVAELRSYAGGAELAGTTGTRRALLRLPPEIVTVRDGARMVERVIEPALWGVAFGHPPSPDEQSLAEPPPPSAPGERHPNRLANVLESYWPADWPLLYPVKLVEGRVRELAYSASPLATIRAAEVGFELEQRASFRVYLEIVAQPYNEPMQRLVELVQERRRAGTAPMVAEAGR